MTVQTIYRILCDAPYCTASTVVEKLGGAPEGWSQIDSTAHLAGKPAPMIGRGRNRRPVDGWDIGNGSFWLYLCPEHPDTFGEHRPQTVGYPTRAAPSCSCGWASGSLECVRIVGRRPSSVVEYAWWNHLPEELRWYATRRVTADPPAGA